MARVKREKRVATENLIISEQMKQEKLQLIRSDVLKSYETYKEKKELVVIQKNSLEYDYSAYLAAQKAFAEGDIKIDVMDRAYQTYLGQKVNLVTKELDLKIAIIELEQLIGIPLAQALDQALKL
jgi:outer membrane protein TolC